MAGVFVQGGWVKTRRDRAGTKSEVEVDDWVRRYRASGKSLKGFAAEHGLSRAQLHYWVYGRRKKSGVEAAPVFRELCLPTPWTQPVGWVAEIGFQDGTLLRLDGRADVAWVGSLVESLRRSCSR